MILLTIKLPTVPEIEPLQRQRSGLYAHLYKKERNGPASADLAYLHPAKTPQARHVVTMPAHLPLSYPFC